MKDYKYPANLPLKDGFDKKKIIKKRAFNLPCNMLVIGKSGSGKSNIAVGMLMRPFDDSDDGGKDFYRHDLKGENIFILSAQANPDEKMFALMEAKDIPAGNVSYIEAEQLEGHLNALYHNIIRDTEQNGFQHRLIFIDDLSYGGALLKKHQGALNEILCNGRKWGISTLITSQNVVDVPTSCRRQCRGLILFAMDDRDKELLSNDFREKIGKKEFYNLISNATEGKHSYLVIDKSEGKVFKERYKDMNFDIMPDHVFKEMVEKAPV